MADDTTQSMGEAQLIEHLVGSVLSSIVKAQGLAATQLVDMVDKVGFYPPDNSVSVPRQVRTFSFDFVRTEVDAQTGQIVKSNVTATVPLLTLVNIPAIAIQEATIDMDLQLVSHEETKSGGAPGQLDLYAVPAKKQVVRTADQAMTVDSAGTIKLHIVMRQENALGLDKIQRLLDSGGDEHIKPLSTTGPASPAPLPAPGTTPPS
jgi:hypothetical protein